MSKRDEIRAIVGELRELLGGLAPISAPAVAVPEPVKAGEIDVAALLVDLEPDHRGQPLDLTLALENQRYYSKNSALVKLALSRVEAARREIWLAQARGEGLQRLEARQQRRASRKAEEEAAKAAAEEARQEERRKLPAFKQD